MSRIRRVEIHELSYTARDIASDGHNPVYTPGGSQPMSKFAVVIDTDEGERGEYVALWAGTKIGLAQALHFAPKLVGRDPYAREALAGDFVRMHRKYDQIGWGPIDICLWDLAGKAYGASVAQMLGGFRQTLPAYASTLHGDRNGGLDSPAAFADYAAHCADLGYTGFKIHSWSSADVREESASLRAVAERVGERMAIMIDLSSQLRTFGDAVTVGRVCDEIGAFWYEDPIHPSSVSAHAHRKLRQLVRTPLLITEHVRGLQPKADFLIAEATDFLRVDPEYDQGITGTMKTAALAQAFGVDVEIHGAGPAQRHCMAAIPNTNFYELILAHPKVGNNLLPPVYADGYRDEVDAISADGTFAVPTGPGLGVTYDWEWIDAHRSGLHVFE